MYVDYLTPTFSSLDLATYGVSVGYECPLGAAFLISTDPEEYAVSINMTCKWEGTWEKTHPQLEECKRTKFTIAVVHTSVLLNVPSRFVSTYNHIF